MGFPHMLRKNLKRYLASFTSDVWKTLRQTDFPNTLRHNLQKVPGTFQSQKVPGTFQSQKVPGTFRKMVTGTFAE